MSNEITQKKDLKYLLSSDLVKSKLEEILGKRTSIFTTSLIQIANSNDLLKNAEPNSILNAGMVSATLNLPLNNSLGFAYIVPFNNKQKDGTFKTEAQFQIGYKGFIQLAQRSGQFKTISSAAIYEGQLVSSNPLTGFVFDFDKKTSDKVIGYAAFFQLINGFEKTLYMTVEDINKHAGKFSQTFKKGFGLWKNDFDSMANKTVIKLLLSKFAPLSVDMQTAQITDQSVIKDFSENTIDVDYVDNSYEDETKKLEEDNKEEEKNRILAFIESATDLKQLKEAEQFIEDLEIQSAYLQKKDILTAKK